MKITYEQLVKWGAQENCKYAIAFRKQFPDGATAEQAAAWSGIEQLQDAAKYLTGCSKIRVLAANEIARRYPSFGGYLYLCGCDLKGITLPTSVGGSLDLSGCDLKGITLPTSVGGGIYR